MGIVTATRPGDVILDDGTIKALFPGQQYELPDNLTRDADWLVAVRTPTGSGGSGGTPAAPAAAATSTDEDDGVIDLKALRKPALLELAEERGVDTAGDSRDGTATAAELRERLAAA